MKLKGLGNRNYNVIFHTHTVAGIVISFALFVIFYAGAFALFREEIYLWEDQEARVPVPEEINPDLAIQNTDNLYKIDWSVRTNVVLPSEHKPFFQIFAAIEDSTHNNGRIKAVVNPVSYEVVDTYEPKTTLGMSIYYLHYFRQIPVIGLYLSGFVALFFLFASVTGLLIHWQNILTKFYAFVTEGKWKQIWTNAHTVLGVIGFPFQVMYAITGALFGLLTLILLPSVLILFDGDTQKIFKDIRPFDNVEISENSPPSQNLPINDLISKVQQEYPSYEIIRMSIKNYGKKDAIVSFGLDDHKGLMSNGEIMFSMASGQPMPEYSIFPNEITYTQSILSLITKFHFATFGGLFMKIIYFLMAMLTCFMILSGVLIWQTARDNDRYTLQQRRFHHRTTKAYLAICLSMFPAFALFFLMNKLIPLSWGGRATTVEQIFFGSWFMLTLIGLFWNNYARINKNYLFIGGILSLFVPIVNGLITGDWFWLVWNTFPTVAYVDIFWLMTGLVALWISVKVLQIPKTSLSNQEAADLEQAYATQEVS